jgi:hypothetical protein
MEQLLLVLFLVFSVVSALLERRKRKQQLEEAQEREPSRPQSIETAPAAVEKKEEEEEWGDWPLPSGDPFDQPRAKPKRHVESSPSMPSPTADAQALLRQIEAQARGAEERMTAQQAKAQARARQARQVQSPRRVAELLQQRQTSGKPLPTRRIGRYHLTPAKARDAVVYVEIIGPCKAEQEEEWRW